MQRAGRALLLFLGFSFTVPSYAGQTVLWMQSEPGDYIGQGQEWLYTDEDAPFYVTKNYQNGVSLSLNKFEYPNWFFWSVNFAAASGQLLSPGVYENAMRYPFSYWEGRNGLSVSGMGRGCNRLSGEFKVLEIEYGVGSEITRFAADFTQRCEETGPPLRGSLRVNSDIPVSTLFPPVIEIGNGVNTEGCVEATSPDGALVNLLGSSQQDDGSFVYSWTTDSGLTEAGNAFTFNLGVDKSMGVALTITNPVTTEEAIATQVVCVSDTTPPAISISPSRQ